MKMWRLNHGYSVYALFSLGTLLTTLVVYRVIELLLVYPNVPLGVLVVTVVLFPVLGVIFHTASELTNSNWGTQEQERVLLWTGAGVILFTSVNLIIMTFLPPGGVNHVIGWLTWAITVGSGVGSGIGYFEGKSVIRARKEERAAIRAEEAESREELLDYLNSILRHEVLNSANIIQGYTTSIRDGEDLSPKSYEALTVIENQSAEMSGIIKDVRVLLTGTKTRTSFDPVSVNDVLDRELEKVTERFQDVETSITSDKEIHILADPLFRRIFTNLLSNAVQHNESPVPTVNVEVEAGEDSVEICVEDNGPGFTQVEEEQLFQPKSEGEPNHGLGLMIVQTLTRRYNGTVELTETGPDGSRFTLMFPLIRGDLTESETQPTDLDSSVESKHAGRRALGIHENHEGDAAVLDHTQNSSLSSD